jgi:hypothetical protein
LRRGLVQKQPVRAGEKASRDANPLLLAALPFQGPIGLLPQATDQVRLDQRPLELVIHVLWFQKTQSMHFGETSHPRTSRSHPLVVMMQSAHFREGDHRALFRRRHRAGVRAVHGQRQMRAPAMVMLEIAGQEAPEVALAQHDPPIQTLPPVLPIRRSATAFCQGLRGAVRTYSMPKFVTPR